MVSASEVSASVVAPMWAAASEKGEGSLLLTITVTDPSTADTGSSNISYESASVYDSFW